MGIGPPVVGIFPPRVFFSSPLDKAFDFGTAFFDPLMAASYFSPTRPSECGLPLSTMTNTSPVCVSTM